MVNELIMRNSSGETLSANSYPLKDTVTVQLMKNKGGIWVVWFFSFIWNYASDKMRLSFGELVHQHEQEILYGAGLPSGILPF